jgi:FMN-dependent NADH-azoreductase
LGQDLLAIWLQEIWHWRADYFSILAGIDQAARAGIAFSYADGAVKGLIIGKKAMFIIATGGNYDSQTQMTSFNFAEPYLRSIFMFLGVTGTNFLTAGGTMALTYGQDRESFLAPHVQAVQTHAQALQGGRA